MAHEIRSIAPWAEIIPDAPYPMSVEEFDRWPEEPGWRYELIWGRLVRMPWPRGQHGIIALRLSHALEDFVGPRGLGVIQGCLLPAFGLDFRFVPPPFQAAHRPPAVQVAIEYNPGA